MEEQRTYHWPATADGIAQTLVSTFSEGHLHTRAYKNADNQIVVQIETVESDRGGKRRAALTVQIAEQNKMVSVTFDDHNVTGATGDLLRVGLRAARNPLTALGRLDDINDDLATLQLPKAVWEAVESYVANAVEPQPEGIVICRFCDTSVPVGILTCPACGASLGSQQPTE